MGIFKNIKDRMEERRLSRVEKDLQKINERNKISFNPFCIDTINLGLTSKNFSNRTLENYVWFTASIPLLRNYYKVNKGIDERLDDLTTNIDSLDCCEYSLEPFFCEMIRFEKSGVK